jgi:DNA topoisomerase-1
MVVKKSWRGPFLACSGYPKCKNARSLNEKATSKDEEED